MRHYSKKSRKHVDGHDDQAYHFHTFKKHTVQNPSSVRVGRCVLLRVSPASSHCFEWPGSFPGRLFAVPSSRNIFIARKEHGTCGKFFWARVVSWYGLLFLYFFLHGAEMPDINPALSQYCPDEELLDMYEQHLFLSVAIRLFLSQFIYF